MFRVKQSLLKGSDNVSRETKLGKMFDNVSRKTMKATERKTFHVKQRWCDQTVAPIVKKKTRTEEAVRVRKVCGKSQGKIIY